MMMPKPATSINRVMKINPKAACFLSFAILAFVVTK